MRVNFFFFVKWVKGYWERAGLIPPLPQLRAHCQADWCSGRVEMDLRIWRSISLKQLMPEYHLESLPVSSGTFTLHSSSFLQLTHRSTCMETRMSSEVNKNLLTHHCTIVWALTNERTLSGDQCWNLNLVQGEKLRKRSQMSSGSSPWQEARTHMKQTHHTWNVYEDMA